MKYIVFLLSFFTLTSCVKVYVGHDPFSASDNFLKGNVRSVTETEFEAKIVSGRTTKGRELGNIHREFNEFGKMTVYQKKSVNTPVIRSDYQYDPFGRILSIKSSQYDNYVPHFNETGNLLYLEFTENGSRQFFYDTYAYNETGQVVRHFRKCSELDKERFVMQFENRYKYRSDGTLEEIERIEGTQLRQVSKYNNAGNLVLFENYNPTTNRVADSRRYEYTFDDVGNWITQTTIEGNRIAGFVERTIDYYPDEYLYISETHIQKLSAGEFFAASLQRLFGNKKIARTQQGNMLYVMLSLSVIVYIYMLYRKRKTIFGNFSGRKDSPKMWMYNKHPYLNVARIIWLVVFSLFGSVLLILLGGLLVILLFWIAGNILVALWGLGLLICFGGGILAAIQTLRGRGCFFGIVGIVAFIIGGLLGNMKQPPTNTKIIDIGIGVFDNLNIVSLFVWAGKLLANYWDVLLVALVIPMILFLTIAVITIFLCWLLIAFEMFITVLYNINNPCPVCGCKVQPKYIIGVNEEEYKKPLRPGVYGLFYHNFKGEKLPTMLINGRSKLKKRCKKCDKITDPKDFGTDIHIGFVGHKSSGKSFLMVNGLYLLKNQKKNFNQTDITQNKSIDFMKIEADQNRLGGTDRTNYRAIQFIYKRKLRKIPYHLYFYDVAGEQFNVADTKSHEAVRFYKNVKSFVFLIDPIMINYTGSCADPDFLKWVNDYIRKYPSEKGNHNPEDTLSSLINMLKSVGHSSQSVDMNIVCVKMDRENGNWDFHKNFIQNNDIEKFICETLGLTNVVNTAKSRFRTVNFYAVSAIDPNTDHLKKLFTDILKQRGVRI